MVVPLVGRGRHLGNFVLGRREVRPFTSAQATILQAFADQAVIAVTNAGLFNDLAESVVARGPITAGKWNAIYAWRDSRQVTMTCTHPRFRGCHHSPIAATLPWHTEGRSTLRTRRLPSRGNREAGLSDEARRGHRGDEHRCRDAHAIPPHCRRRGSPRGRHHRLVAGCVRVALRNAKGAAARRHPPA